MSQPADLDRGYEQERRIIERALHSQPWNDWRLVRLKESHESEGLPLVQLLCLLHQQVASKNLWQVEPTKGLN